MRVVFTLVVCSPLAVLVLAQPAPEQRDNKAKHGVGAPHRHKQVFLDQSQSLTGVEAEVRAQRLDAEKDARTQELMSQIGKMEGELEDAQEGSMRLNHRIAKEEVSFAQKEEKFQSRIAEFEYEKKIADVWLWRLEMGLIAQLMFALVTGLSCLLCQLSFCNSTCNALVKTVDKDSNMHAKHWHRPMDPELKEKLRIRRMNLDGLPRSATKQEGNVAGAVAEQPDSCTYFNMTEGDHSEAEEATPETPRSSAFAAVFSETRSPPSMKPQQAQVAPPSAVEENWWGTSH